MIHTSVESWFRALNSLVLCGILVALGWVRPGWPPLSHLAGPCQHFEAAFFLVLGGPRYVLTFASGRVFREVLGRLHLLHASHVRDRDNALLRTYSLWESV